MMESRPSGIILLFCALAAAMMGTSEAQVSVEVTISESMGPGAAYHIGSNITMMCRVRGGYIGMDVKLHKMVVLESGEDVKELMATNSILTPLYSKPRFVYSVVNTGEVTLFIFNIYGVQRQDTGHYTCAVPAADDGFDSASLQVYSPPVEIAFDGFTNGELVYFTEGMSKSMTCLVTDIVPAPEVTVTVGSQDVTADFVAHSELELKCSGSASDKDCPIHFTYNHALTASAFQPSYQSDGAVLTCSASWPGTDIDPVTTSLMVSYAYAPKIICETTQMVQLGADHDIMCLVHSQPRPTLAYWHFTVGDTEYQIFPGDTTPNQQYESFYKELDSQQFEYTLRLFNVDPEELAMYHVSVESPMGTTEETVLLERDMMLPVLSAASPVLSSLLYLLAAVLTSLVLRT